MQRSPLLHFAPFPLSISNHECHEAKRPERVGLKPLLKFLPELRFAPSLSPSFCAEARNSSLSVINAHRNANLTGAGFDDFDEVHIIQSFQHCLICPRGTHGALRRPAFMDEGQQLCFGERRDGISCARIVGELDQNGVLVQIVHYGADLTTRQIMFRRVGEQRDDIQFLD